MINSWNNTYTSTTTTPVTNICIDAIVDEIMEKICNKSSKEKVNKINNTVKPKMPKIKNIDFQPPLTVVIWEDGTKTFVKCLDTDDFDPEKGAAMAIAKKALGDKYHYNDVINYYTEKYYKKHPNTSENKSVDLSVTEQDIIWLMRHCGEETEQFIFNTLMEIYTGM